MRLVTFVKDTESRIGAFDPKSNQIIDLAVADPNLPKDMNAFIDLGKGGLKKASIACQSAGADARIDADTVTLLAPIPKPRRNIFCVGLNYHEHVNEFQKSGFDAAAGTAPVPDYPIIFTKATSSVIGPGAAINSALDYTNSVDYEGELGVIIHKSGRGISKADAFDYVYGYTIINDVTARTQQHQHKQWFVGKSLDTFCPMGPVLLTADEAGDVNEFHLTTMVNGETRQDTTVAKLIFDIPTLIETLSKGTTLISGDIIATGTPVGVGIGFKPPVFLQPGDTVSITIQPIGTLENRVE